MMIKFQATIIFAEKKIAKARPVAYMQCTLSTGHTIAISYNEVSEYCVGTYFKKLNLTLPDDFEFQVGKLSKMKIVLNWTQKIRTYDQQEFAEISLDELR